MTVVARWRRLGLLTPFILLGCLSAQAEEPKVDKAVKPQPPNQTPVTELNVSPAAAPLPIFRYRLHPVAGKLMPGNAAPVYLRIRHDITQEAWDQISKNSIAWLDLPLDKMPVKEAREFVNVWKSKLKQIEIGTRRETCDWGYSIAEQRGDIINLMLPDAQTSRNWARLIALKARVEIAEGDLDEAVHTVGTGLAFARHVAEGPFYINSLIGVAIESIMLDRLEEIINRPDAPNLYWALTAIPRPFISQRKQMEIEQRFAENMIPEMNDVFVSHSATEWTVIAEKIYAGMQRVAHTADPSGQGIPAEIRKQLAEDYPTFKKRYLEQLRITLRKTLPKSKGSVSTMTDDEVMARGIVNQYRIHRDEGVKDGYLPYLAAIQQLETGKRPQELKEGPVAVFEIFQPNTLFAMIAEIRLERRIAMLRTVEAIRMYAAAHDGKLPESLDAITEVPIPIDPATDKPFPFSREGDVAVLTTPNVGQKLWPIFRITIRK